jgi:hypothetical protein
LNGSRSIWLKAALLLIGGFTRAAADCQCPPATPKEQTELATYVFNGDIWDISRPVGGGKAVITFDVNDTFKGDPPPRLELEDQEDGGECALNFHEGESYLVYTRWRWGTTLTSRCWGTQRLDKVGAEGQALGPGSIAKSRYYEKLRVLCMGRRDTRCCLSSIKAMQDGGFLPKTDDSCPDGMIPDRLKCAGSYTWCVPATEPRRHNESTAPARNGKIGAK